MAVLTNGRVRLRHRGPTRYGTAAAAAALALAGVTGCNPSKHGGSSNPSVTISSEPAVSDATDSTDPSGSQSSDTTDPGSSDASSGSSDSSGSAGTFSGKGKNISDLKFNYDGQQITGLTGDAGFFCSPSGYGIQTFDEVDHSTPVTNGSFDDSFTVSTSQGDIKFTFRGTIDGSSASGNLSVNRPYCTTEGDWTATAN